MSADIVERLRRAANPWPYTTDSLLIEAADEIERLRRPRSALDRETVERCAAACETAGASAAARIVRSLLPVAEK